MCVACDADHPAGARSIGNALGNGDRLASAEACLLTTRIRFLLHPMVQIVRQGEFVGRMNRIPGINRKGHCCRQLNAAGEH